MRSIFFRAGDTDAAGRLLRRRSRSAAPALSPIIGFSRRLVRAEPQQVSTGRTRSRRCSRKVARLQAAQARTAAHQGSDQARVAAFAAASARGCRGTICSTTSRACFRPVRGSRASTCRRAHRGAATDPAGPTPTATPTSFTVYGHRLHPGHRRRVMQRLELVPALSGRDAAVEHPNRRRDSKAYQFTMNASVARRRCREQ